MVHLLHRLYVVDALRLVTAVIVHLCLQWLRVHDAVTDSTQELHPCVLPAVVLVAGTQQTSIVVLQQCFFRGRRIGNPRSAVVITGLYIQ